MKKLFYTAALLLLTAMAALGATRSKKNAIARNLDLFSSVFKEMQTFYVDTIDADKAVATAINAMLSELDPYTVYMPKQEAESFNQSNAGEFGGIGSYIVQRDSVVMISGPHEGTPAHRAGLRHGDVIVSIDGDTMLGRSVNEVTTRLKGTPGTPLTVVLRRPYSADSILTVNMVRDKIKTPSVAYSAVMPDGIGYIGLTQFTATTPDEVREALTAMKKNPALKGVVLDLRSNPGGLLESAVSVVSNFVPKGTEVLRTIGKGVLQETVYKTTSSPVDTKLPLVVLIDDESASSSEITAGALQDLDRAVIVGNRSFGKGLVQITRDLPYDGTLKVTVAKYYIPSGRLIQAIDYSHRNADGSVARIPDSLTTAFTTANGRTVRDGGGITPDVDVTYPSLSRLTYNIISDFWAFDFANRYFAEHPDDKPDIATFTITDSIYEDFKRSIDPAKFEYDKVCNTMLERLRSVARIEGYQADSIDAELSRLEAMFNRPLSHELDTHRPAIEPILKREIMERYYLEPGRIATQLLTDPGLDSARAVIMTPGRIGKILSGK